MCCERLGEKGRRLVAARLLSGGVSGCSSWQGWRVERDLQPRCWIDRSPPYMCALIKKVFYNHWYRDKSQDQRQDSVSDRLKAAGLLEGEKQPYFPRKWGQQGDAWRTL